MNTETAEQEARQPENEAPSAGNETAQPEDSAVSELEKCRKEADQLRDSWTRERAEFMNFRKRSSHEQIRMRHTAVANFVKALLPVLDNLERTISVPTDVPEVKNFVSGVAMIHQELVSVLEKEKIRPMKAAGQPFDPFSMEAIAMEDREGLERDTVLEVYEEGYFMEAEENERQVIRPSRVKVGKPAPAQQ